MSREGGSCLDGGGVVRPGSRECDRENEDGRWGVVIRDELEA